MSVKLCKWGNSLGLRLPKYVTERVGLTAGDYVFVRLLDSGEIMVRPVKAKAVPLGYTIIGPTDALIEPHPGDALHEW